ncbi:MAG TPA: hypothetical protein VF384_17950 [Planctomycetota bacterium]
MRLRWPSLWCCLLAGCLSPFESRHESQSNARDQIWMSEESQVKLRAAQSRLFDSTDRVRILSAVVATMQDLGFMVEVLDEELGIVSGTRFVASEGEPWLDPSYHLYDDKSLLLFTRSYRTWGPFYHRSDLVRLTVTVRKRNDAQSVVRASAQFYLRAVEDPEHYQRFFRALEQALFLQAQLVEEPTGKG